MRAQQDYILCRNVKDENEDKIEKKKREKKETGDNKTQQETNENFC